MKDLIYLAITSAAMCSIIAVYAHLVGFSKGTHFRDRKHAKELVKRLNSGKTISTLKLSTDQRLALAIFSDDTASLLYPLGRRWVAHELEKNSIKSMKIKKNGNLHIAFPDFTAPGLNINIENNAAEKSWLSALQPFARGSALSSLISAQQ